MVRSFLSCFLFLFLSISCLGGYVFHDIIIAQASPSLTPKYIVFCSLLSIDSLIILFLSFLAVNSLIILAYVSHGSKSEVAYDVNRAAGWEDVYL